MIRKANMEDINEIMNIVNLSIQDMKNYDNFQWSEKYPLEEDFIKDIEERCLYVKEIDGNIGGFICINTEEPSEYDELVWQGKNPLLIHRMAVNAKYFKQKIGSELFLYAIQMAKAKNDSIRTDTNIKNLKMISLLNKFGFKERGNVIFYKSENPYIAFEIAIENK